jgi:nucleoid-associated protein YgaU
MDADKKLGFALGILLCGIVGAFFFRDEAEPTDKPQLADASKLDDQIRQKAQSPYLPDAGTNEITEVPDVFVADVMPTIPGGNLREPSVIPEPIRRSASNDPGIDLVTPIPSPSSEAQLDAAFDRANLRNNVAPNLAQDNDRPRLSQQRPASVVPIVIGQIPNTSIGNVAQTPAQAATHNVVAGDTLSEIASKYLGTHRRYKEVFEFNRDILKTPNDLRPGMVLKIPGKTQNTGSSTTNAPRPTNPSIPETPTVSPERTGELFVRPPRSPLSPVPRVTQAPGGSLSQLPPPGVPHVEGLLDPTVIAARLKADSNPDGTANKTTRD